jgi:hypothetical protein
MTPRLLSSTTDGGINVSPASLEGSVNAMITGHGKKGNILPSKFGLAHIHCSCDLLFP